ncbi:UNVERIFIED_CONTAM: protein IQ-DOMAIN 1 [Sesamum calycinum]|uniref:Protein IQ-DOMAIN 1 n=1 Tax=Sesamum calycinum TaxID=2727403 RepID=A0AAW2R7V3_9LAMI
MSRSKLRNDIKMGRKGSWFSSVKKVLSPDSKEKKAEKANKLKQKWFGKEKPSVSYSPTPAPDPVELPEPHPLPPVEEVKLTEVEDEQTKHAYSVAVATAAAAEAAVAAAQAAAEVVRLTTVTQFVGKSKEEVAAIRIQTAFRGYLARRALRALRGLVRLKLLVDGPTAKRQTSNTLKCMQTLSRVQSQIQSRRIRMLEENRALQRQLLQKRARELESLRMGEDWDDSLQSKEQIEASLLHKYEAAMRRERALAYSYTHQQTWKKSTKPTNLLFMDPTNPQWGWSWLDRWMAAQSGIAVGEITKSFARHQLNSDNPSSPVSQKPPSSHLSPASPSSKPVASKLKPASPRGSTIIQDDDSRSVVSVGNRRHSIAGSSVRDDESVASFSSVPSYMAPTRSAKAKSKLPSPLGLENGTAEKGSSAGLAKKRLSFPPSPARTRRHSGPPKVDTSSITNNDVNGVLS